MKKAIIALSILCTGTLAISPITFAQGKANINNKEIIQNINKDETNNAINNNKLTNEEKVDIPQEEVNENISNQTEDNKDEVSVEVNKTITKEQAKDLLEVKNPNVEYLYQGDENNFGVLKDKGLSGYVFLPNVEGDMGYFVDKTTQEIYYFHPSGYLELIK